MDYKYSSDFIEEVIEHRKRGCSYGQPDFEDYIKDCDCPEEDE